MSANIFSVIEVILEAVSQFWKILIANSEITIHRYYQIKCWLDWTKNDYQSRKKLKIYKPYDLSTDKISKLYSTILIVSNKTKKHCAVFGWLYRIWIDTFDNRAKCQQHLSDCNWNNATKIFHYNDSQFLFHIIFFLLIKT